MNGKSINLASKGQLPVQISSASSLDSFLIDLPPPSELALQVNSCGGFGIDTTEAEEVTTESSLSPPNNDSMLFAANLFFDLDDSNSVREQAFAFEGLHVAMPSTARSQGRSLAPASSSAAVLINNSVPEFLYQLTKMLTDKNTDVIEWANGK